MTSLAADMIRWLVLAVLVSSSKASRPRGIRAEVTFLTPLSSWCLHINMHMWKKSGFIWALIHRILASIFWKQFEFVCRLLHCTILARISDVLTGVTLFPSSKSMTTTAIVRWENPNTFGQFHSIRSRFNFCNGQDGSDEPGTSACPNGKFFCENAGHKALVIPSGRVSGISLSLHSGGESWHLFGQCYWWKMVRLVMVSVTVVMALTNGRPGQVKNYETWWCLI